MDQFDIEIGSGLPGVPDRFGGQVDAGHGVPAAGELEAVPPAAARHVQDPRARRETEPFLDEGRPLFSAVCKLDLEGIVAKRLADSYSPGKTKWLKILNPTYSQKVDRGELFERRYG